MTGTRTRHVLSDHAELNLEIDPKGLFTPATGPLGIHWALLVDNSALQTLQYEMTLVLTGHQAEYKDRQDCHIKNHISTYFHMEHIFI